MFDAILFAVAAAAYLIVVLKHSGTAISRHPYGNPYDDAPGARANGPR
jgi:hypothetical protein